MKKDEILGYGLLIVICVFGFITLCINAEHYDAKKELSTQQPTTTESR
mgnify:CR=1 FL=1